MKSLVVIVFVFFNVLMASPLELKSTQKRVNIIELYTSQGCSSCPAADAWLGRLKNSDKLFKEFIPMAFHVTYWDFIGWKDTFAKKSNDVRQREYSSDVWNRKSVYTPQFVLNAKEYREWFSTRSFPDFEEQYGGELKAKVENKTMNISFYSQEIQNKKVTVNIVLMGFDYDVKITSGENEDKILEHDFVVLEHIQERSFIKNNKLLLKTHLPYIQKDSHSKAISVWISDEQNQIIQAVGGYLNN